MYNNAYIDRQINMEAERNGVHTIRDTRHGQGTAARERVESLETHLAAGDMDRP